MASINHRRNRLAGNAASNEGVAPFPDTLYEVGMVLAVLLSIAAVSAIALAGFGRW
jgi:hypothetical protein